MSCEYTNSVIPLMTTSPLDVTLKEYCHYTHQWSIMNCLTLFTFRFSEMKSLSSSRPRCIVLQFMYVLASIADVRGKHMTTVTLVQLRYAGLHNTFITAVVLLALFPYDSYCVKKAVEGFEEHNHIYLSKVNGVFILGLTHL